jgi:APA family basic amino acid/polyamine antiporter
MVGAIVCLVDTRSAIGFSSFSILVYYAIANACAFRLRKEERSWPRWMAILGFIACVGVAFSLPSISIALGILVFAVGAVVRVLRPRIR